MSLRNSMNSRCGGGLDEKLNLAVSRSMPASKLTVP